MQPHHSKAIYIADQYDDVETKQTLNTLAAAFHYSDLVSSDVLAVIKVNLSALVDELQGVVPENDFATTKVLTKANNRSGMENNNSISAQIIME